MWCGILFWYFFRNLRWIFTILVFLQTHFQCILSHWLERVEQAYVMFWMMKRVVQCYNSTSDLKKKTKIEFHIIYSKRRPKLSCWQSKQLTLSNQWERTYWKCVCKKTKIVKIHLRFVKKDQNRIPHHICQKKTKIVSLSVHQVFLISVNEHNYWKCL